MRGQDDLYTIESSNRIDMVFFLATMNQTDHHVLRLGMRLHQPYRSLQQA